MLGHNDFHIIKAHKIELKQQKFPPKQFSWLEKFPTDKDIKVYFITFSPNITEIF
jgi:hypothetical protein